MQELSKHKSVFLDSIVEKAATEFTSESNIRPGLIASEFINKMESRGINLTDEEQHYALAISHKLSKLEFLEKPNVFAVPCGYGKSTLLETFLQSMLHFEKTFGAVVVKTKRAEVKELTQKLNFESITGDPLLIRKHKRAVSLLGQSDEDMTYGEYRAQFIDMKNANVLIMTSEMFSRYANARALGDLRDFEIDGRAYTREFLFIDERPKFVDTHRLTANEVSRVINDVKAISQELYKKDSKYYREFYQAASKLRQELEKPRDGKGQFLIDFVNFNYSIPDQLRRDWFQYHSETNFDLLGAVGDAIKWGGVAYVSNGQTILEVANKVSYDWTKFKTHIFDATATSDPFYNENDFEFLTFGQAVNYKNVRLLFNRSTNLSRSFFEENPDALYSTLKMTKKIIKDHNKTLIIVYKKYYDEAYKHLEKEITEERAYLHYFDGGRSTNEFRDADAVIALGWNKKHPAYYPAVTSALLGEIVSPISDRDRVLGGRYEDDRVNDFVKWDEVTDTTQAINRTRPLSNKERKISVYLFNRSDELLQAIAYQFPGASLTEYVPREKLSGNRTQADVLIDFLEEMGFGESYNITELSRETGIPRNTITNALKTKRVIAVMQELKIVKDGRKYRRKAF